jgi:hypothetical protein
MNLVKQELKKQVELSNGLKKKIICLNYQNFINGSNNG